MLNILSLVAVLPLVAAQSSKPTTQPVDQVSMRDRAFITAKLYSAVDTYFGHLSAIPDFKLDEVYPRFLDRAFAAPNRYEFDLACLEFVASLKNGHTNFWDSYLDTYNGESLGFTLRNIENQWVVDFSRISELAVGDVIATIDGKPVEDVYQANKKYLCGSSDRDCRTRFSRTRFLFPREFSIAKSDGTQARIKRVPFIQRMAEKTTGRWLMPQSVAYIKVPGFDNPGYETDALKLVKEFSNAKSLVIDVRQNGGGSTPAKLIDALMDRPYSTDAWTTPQTIGAFRVYGAYATSVENDPDVPKDADFGELRALRDLGYTQYFVPSTRRPTPVNGYKGRLFILIDRGSFSAAEDFCIPFKGNGRATFIGEATGGSTGQPYIVTAPNGMGFRVSTKRTSMPDGSPFEGVGIQPDVLIPTTISDIKTGKDSVLERALDLARR